jgi:nitroreductase
VAEKDLLSLFEAARWAPSSYNEQPWSYIVATKDSPEEFKRLLGCLVEGNQEWAQHAPVLVLCVTTLNFKRNDKPNKAAIHDLGLAAGNVCFEATERGLFVHQMIGILPDVARDTYSIPDGSEATTAMAIGYAADPETLSDKIKERDTSSRGRKPLSEFVFSGKWGTTAGFVRST